VDSVLAGSPLDGSKREQFSTATGLQQLLLFADAVGSVGGVLHACLSGLKDLKLLKVGSEAIELRMGRNAGGYCGNDEHALYYVTLQASGSDVIATFADEDDVLEFEQQLVTQTEALLYVGHMLQLPELLRTVHSFIFKCHVLDDGALEGALSGVFTERVLAAAVGSSRLSRDAYVTSVLTQPCSAHGEAGLHRLLKVVQHPHYDSEEMELRWHTQLAKDFLGCVAGSELDVRLDLLSPQ
jgi:hypothetical protein